MADTGFKLAPLIEDYYRPSKWIAKVWNVTIDSDNRDAELKVSTTNNLDNDSFQSFKTCTLKECTRLLPRHAAFIASQDFQDLQVKMKPAQRLSLDSVLRRL
jgi:hypothetical protein